MKKVFSLIAALLITAAAAAPAVFADGPEYGELVLGGLFDYWGETDVTVTFEAAVQETGSITSNMDGTHFYTREDVNVIVVRPGSSVTVSCGDSDTVTAGGIVTDGDHFSDTPPFYAMQVSSGSVSDWFDGKTAPNPHGDQCPIAYVVLNAGENDYYIRLGDGTAASDAGEAPAEEQAAPAETINVVMTSQRLTVNGEEKNAEIYNINDKNYFKLRDIAALLSGTGSQFSVDYDAETRTIVITKGGDYTPSGSELVIGEDKSASCVVSAQSVVIDGEKVELAAYNLGGNNFFGLRDLGEALGFDVAYDAETRTMIVTSR